MKLILEKMYNKEKGEYMKKISFGDMLLVLLFVLGVIGLCFVYFFPTSMFYNPTIFVSVASIVVAIVTKVIE